MFLQTTVVPFARTLVSKGADITIKSKSGTSALERYKSFGLEFQDIVAQVGAGTEPTSFPLLEVPTPFVPNCCYTTMMIEKHSMQSTELLKRPFLTITLYKLLAGGIGLSSDVVELPQAIAQPSVRRVDYLWWGHCVHLQSPLENLGNTGTGKFNQSSTAASGEASVPSSNTVVLLELKDAEVSGAASSPPPPPSKGQAVGSSGPGKCIAWTLLDISRTKIDSTNNMQLEMYNYPVDLRKQKLDSADMFLSVDVILERAEAEVDEPYRYSKRSTMVPRAGRAVSNVAGKLTTLVGIFSAGKMTESDFTTAKKELLKMDR